MKTYESEITEMSIGSQQWNRLHSDTERLLSVLRYI